MKKSILTKRQDKSYAVEWIEDGKPRALVAEVRYDDQCGNGHNTFSITGSVFDKAKIKGETTYRNADGVMLWCSSGGCVHELIAERIPKLAPYIKWHLCSSEGPMYYVANTVYLAGDRDHRGLRKGETRQIRHGGTGPLAWVLEPTVDLPKYVNSETQPTETAVLRYVPWVHVGEGKERQLDAARRTAIWPEATDEQLMLPKVELTKLLEARLPKLMEEFIAAVESLGFVY